MPAASSPAPARPRRPRAPAAAAFVPPTEHDAQASVVRWADVARGKWPALALLYAVPNGGHRTARAAGRAKAEGALAGVSDLVLPARGVVVAPPDPDTGVRAGRWCPGLYLELKRAPGHGVRKGRVSAAQAAWLDAVVAEGYAGAVAYGAGAAVDVLTAYLSGAPLQTPNAAWWPGTLLPRAS